MTSPMNLGILNPFYFNLSNEVVLFGQTDLEFELHTSRFISDSHALVLHCILSTQSSSIA